MPSAPNFSAYGCDRFVDTGPIAPDRIAAALNARIPTVVAFVETREIGAALAERFASAVAAGALSIREAPTPEAIASFFLTETARCLVWTAPSPMRQDVSRIAEADFKALRRRIAAMGEGQRDDHVVLVDEVRRLKLLNPNGDAEPSVDAVIAAVREINAAYRVGFDHSVATHNVLAFSTDLIERDDVESLAAVLSGPDALSAAALEALDRIGAPLSALADHLPNHHARLGEIALVSGQPHLALAFSMRAAALAPKTIGHRLLACEAARATNRIPTLEENARVAIMLSPDSPHGYRFLGVAMEKSDRPSEAVAAARDAVRRGGASKAFFVQHLAGLHWRLGDAEAAEKTLKSALDDAPDHPALRRALTEMRAARRNGVRGDASATGPTTQKSGLAAATLATRKGVADGAPEGRAQMIPLHEAADGDALRNARKALERVAAGSNDVVATAGTIARLKSPTDRLSDLGRPRAERSPEMEDEEIEATIDDLGRVLEVDLESQMDRARERD